MGITSGNVVWNEAHAPAPANAYAAALNFVGAESVKLVADRVRVSRGWMVPLGTLLAPVQRW